MTTPVFIEQSASYRTLVTRTMVNALRNVFTSGYRDQQFASLKITPRFPLRDVDYPSLVFEFEGKGIYNMGVGHEEWFTDNSGVLRKWHHRRFEGTANFYIYALSPLDRDILMDSVTEILSFGRLDSALLPFFTTIYGDPATNFDWQTMFSQLALNIDEIEEGGVNATVAPWQPEDVLVYSGSLSCDLHGGIYNTVPSATWPLVTKVNQQSYPQFEIDGSVGQLPPDPHPETEWMNPFEYVDQATVRGSGAIPGVEITAYIDAGTSVGIAAISYVEASDYVGAATATAVAVPLADEAQLFTLTTTGSA